MTLMLALKAYKAPIAKFLNEEVWKALAERVKVQTGDILFFGADKWQLPLMQWVRYV